MSFSFLPGRTLSLMNAAIIVDGLSVDANNTVELRVTLWESLGEPNPVYSAVLLYAGYRMSSRPPPPDSLRESVGWLLGTTGWVSAVGFQCSRRCLSTNQYPLNEDHES